MKSDVLFDLRQFLNVFENSTFLLYEAQVFPQYVLPKLCEAEESVSKKHVKWVSLNDVPADANIV